jgi:hypothetical protein
VTVNYQGTGTFTIYATVMNGSLTVINPNGSLNAVDIKMLTNLDGIGGRTCRQVVM